MAGNSNRSKSGRFCGRSTPSPPPSSPPPNYRSTMLRSHRLPIRRFKLFTKLPIEIRFMIWKHLRTGPRMVSFIWKKLEDPKSATPTPILFLICSESRQIATKDYQLLLSSSSEAGTKRIYINPATDTLFIPNLLPSKWRLEPIFNTIHENIRGQLKHLAIDHVMLEHQKLQPGSLKPIAVFQDLDSFTTVFSNTSNGHQNYYGNSVLHQQGAIHNHMLKSLITVAPIERAWREKFRSDYVLVSPAEIKQRLLDGRERIRVQTQEDRNESYERSMIGAVDKTQYELKLLMEIRVTVGGDLSDLGRWNAWVMDAIAILEKDKTWKKPKCNMEYLYRGDLLAKYDF